MGPYMDEHLINFVQSSLKVSSLADNPAETYFESLKVRYEKNKNKKEKKIYK